MDIDKQAVIEQLKSKLRSQYERAVGALSDATEGATGDDSKAESKYDTRGLESSYLAAGQAGQVERLMREIRATEQCDFDRSSKTIDVGSLVIGEGGGQRFAYLISPGGGGVTLEIPQGETITVLNPGAPLAGRMMELKVGDHLDPPGITIVAIV